MEPLVTFLHEHYDVVLQGLKSSFKSGVRTQFLTKSNQFANSDAFITELKEILKRFVEEAISDRAINL